MNGGLFLFFFFILSLVASGFFLFLCFFNIFYDYDEWEKTVSLYTNLVYDTLINDIHIST